MSNSYPFQNPARSPRERAEDLVSRLTREEKIGMVTSHLDAVPRLGIPATHIGVEIARGLVQRDQRRETTILPQPWGMAAMFDPELMEKLGDMAGAEVRISNQMDPPSSLSLFGPTVDMERDPRWGRNEEAYGEDPCLTGHMTAAYTRGLAGSDPRYLKCAPLLKHFYANNYEDERQTTNANISPRLKREYYLKAFEPAIRQGGAVGLMTAYNLINGVEGVNNPDVSEICKKEWGMTFAVSDGGDFGQNVAAHRSYEDHAASIASILGTGADTMLDSRDMVDPAVEEALERGLLKEESLDKAIADLFTLRFMLGDFDPEENPYTGMDQSRLACSDHEKLAVQAAEESMILLENKGLLPLTDDGKCTVAVVGPLANENYTCWYCGYAEHQTPVVEGFRQRLGEGRVLFDEGLDRIVLKSEKTGKYVRLGENGELIADAANAGSAEVFERNDWDYGSWTLRSFRTGKYVTEGGGFAAMQVSGGEPDKMAFDPAMTCTAEQAFGWFVMEHVKAREENGSWFLSTWQDRSIAVKENGSVIAAVLSGDDPAARFQLEVVSCGAERVRKLSEQADHVIVCGGNHPLINAREEYDRPDIDLPRSQGRLLSAAWKGNRSTVLYLITGYPFSITEEREQAGAVLCSTHLGPSLGHVAAKTVFGENNPAGRTPSTWYRSVRDLPAIDDYDIAKNKVTYLYFEGEPLYPFGYGLSYTRFAYSDFQVSARSFGPEDTVTATVTVKNEGDYDGDEVVQLYAVPPQSRAYPRPHSMLRAFRRVSLKKGESKTVPLSFPVEELSFWCTEENSFVVAKGDYALCVGASSGDLRCRETVFVDGKEADTRDGGRWISAIDTQNYRRAQFLTDKRDGKEYLEAADFRSYAVYTGLDISGCNAFEAELSSPAGDVELILADNATGKILGRCGGRGTGGLTRFAAFSCDIVPQSEILDLRICFTKQTSLKKFHFYQK